MMDIPLYVHENIPSEPSSYSNFGLWYDKFGNQWTFKNKDSAEFNKVEWIRKAESFRFEDREIIQEFVWRRIRMIQGLGGRFWVFETQTPLVVGLGRAHPVENGMTWDYISGLPYIPGSSVKGALKASNQQYFDEAYSIIDQFTVLDAIPILPPALSGEVMTPHYGPYYQNTETPGDWFDPNPLPFLTVRSGQRFLFSVIAPREFHAGLDEWMEKTLIWTGVGAKTAVAFGRFQRVKSEEQRLHDALDLLVQTERREKQMQSLSPLEQELWTGGYYDNPDRFMQSMTQKWLEKMEDTDLPKSGRLLIAQKLKDWYLANKPQEWKKPNKKNQLKIARITKILEEV